jgi:hypothetical protein
MRWRFVTSTTVEKRGRQATSLKSLCPSIYIYIYISLVCIYILETKWVCVCVYPFSKSLYTDFWEFPPPAARQQIGEHVSIRYKFSKVKTKKNLNPSPFSLWSTLTEPLTFQNFFFPGRLTVGSVPRGPCVSVLLRLFVGLAISCTVNELTLVEWHSLKLSAYHWDSSWFPWVRAPSLSQLRWSWWRF